MSKDFYGRYIYNGTKGWSGFVINSTNTTKYIDKEDNDFGTWFYDESPSGAGIMWFIAK